MKIEIEVNVPLRVSIPSSKVQDLYQMLMAIRNVSDDRDDENSVLNKLIEELQVKLQWLSERKDRMRENEEWEEERKQLLLETRKQLQEQQEQRQGEPLPS